MTLPEQSLRPRRGGLEHLAVPGRARDTAAEVATSASDATAVVDVPPVVPSQASSSDLVVPPPPASPGPDVDGPPPQRPRPRDDRADRRSWVVVLGVAVVVLLIGGLAAASFVGGGRPGQDVDPVEADAPAAVPGDAAAPASSSGTIDDPVTVATLPGSWAEPVPGDVIGEPVRWTDGAGVNTLVLSAGTGTPGETDDSGSVVAAGSLYVTLFLGDGDSPVVQRQMREPILCDGGSVDLRDDSVRLFDSDGDSVGEVTTGWTVTCPNDARATVAKLSLLEGPDKFILRGPVDGDGAATPDPAPDSWPAGALEATDGMFDELFSR